MRIACNGLQEAVVTRVQKEGVITKEHTPRTVQWQPNAIVSLSAEGKQMAKSQHTIDREMLMEMDPKYVVTSETTRKQQTPPEERSVKELWRAVEQGEELSYNDKGRLIDDLAKDAKTQYEKMLAYFIQDDTEYWIDVQNMKDEEKTRDDKALEELNEQLTIQQLMKQRTLQDMQDEMEKRKAEEEQHAMETGISQSAMEISNKIETLEMLRDSLEKAGEPGISTEQAPKESEEDMETESGELSGAPKQPDDSYKIGLEQLKRSKADAVKAERDYSNMLDTEYGRLLTLLQEDSISVMDKKAAYKQFEVDSKEIAIGREIAEGLKFGGVKAITDIKITALSMPGPDKDKEKGTKPIMHEIGQGTLQDSLSDTIQYAREKEKARQEKRKEDEEQK